MSQLKTAALVLKDCSSYIHGPVGLFQNILQKSLPHKKYKQKQTVPPVKKIHQHAQNIVICMIQFLY